MVGRRALGFLRAGRRLLAWRRALRALAGQAPAAPPPPAVEDPVVHLAIVPPPDEDRGTGGPHRLAIAHVDERQRPRIVDGGSEIDREARPPERPTEPDSFGEQPPPVDLAAVRRRDDRGIWSVAHGHLRQGRAAASAR